MPKKPASEKQIESFVHDEASRRNIPPAEFQTMVRNQEKTPLQKAYERRNPDLDPQLIWRGKDLLDESPLVVNAPPLYIQEKIHPKVLIDDLKRRCKQGSTNQAEQIDLFAAFNGLPSEEAKTEFYQHDQNWSNRMILGDSLQVMASLAEREGLRGKVQCIFFDPPYGIKFNSNFQWSTSNRDVRDGKSEHITREPEQVKAFRDTWKDGIHSYLGYLRDRLVAAHDLLAESGSIFVQIGDENVHRVRAVMDEVFGVDNFCSLLVCRKTSSLNSPVARVNVIPGSADFIIWFAKRRDRVKYLQLYTAKALAGEGGDHYRTVELPNGATRQITFDEMLRPEMLPSGAKVIQVDNLISQGFSETLSQQFTFGGRPFSPGRTSHWKTTLAGLSKLTMADRLVASGKTLRYKRFFADFPVMMVNSIWEDIGADSDKTYVVQTPTAAIKRCIVMSTDPGDLVLDPTCGSGTTAAVAEQWGRRWITIDTSRVSLALARARIMGARFPYYLLADSAEGKQKEAELIRSIPSSDPVSRNIRQGFVYERVPHITLKSIANNTEIDTIWEKWQSTMEPLREQLNIALGKAWQEWEIPREAQPTWSDEAKDFHANWWDARIARQKKIDASIAAKADSEYLYDKPYEDKSKVRVAGPFTVESLSPHRTMIVNDDDTITDPLKQGATAEGATDFAQMILNTLRVAGVQQAHKQDRISFESLDAWPGVLLAGKGSYRDVDGTLKTAGIFIGPEFGTVTRVDLVEAARECADAGFNVLISCAFNYEAQSTEFDKLGPIPVLKARMNADLHMQQDLANSGKGNLFVIFGEPDIDILDATGPDGQPNQIQVKINGVDVSIPPPAKSAVTSPTTLPAGSSTANITARASLCVRLTSLGRTTPIRA